MERRSFVERRRGSSRARWMDNLSLNVVEVPLGELDGRTFFRRLVAENPLGGLEGRTIFRRALSSTFLSTG